MWWPEDAVDASLLVLSAHDDLGPAAMVQEHLRHTKSPCKVPALPCAAGRCTAHSL